jgi:hypothetical protein
MKINNKLEPLKVNSYEVSAATDMLIKHVLKVIPDGYIGRFPPFSVYESYLHWDSPTEERGIFCDPGLPNMPVDVAIGTLSHKFAHLFLGQDTGCSGNSPEQEKVADELACSWGFVREIEAMHRYLNPPREKREGTNGLVLL